MQRRRRGCDCNIVSSHQLVRIKELVDVHRECRGEARAAACAEGVAEGGAGDGDFGYEIVEFLLDQAVFGCCEGD